MTASALLYAVFFLVWAGSPQADGKNGMEQPIAFSHKVHSRLGIECAVCHAPLAETGKLNVPKPSECTRCHQGSAPKNPELRKLAEFDREGREIPWLPIYKIPDYVEFSHDRHSREKCRICHGPVQECDVLRKESDISMKGCIACHRSRGVSIKCNLCHQISP